MGRMWGARTFVTAGLAGRVVAGGASRAAATQLSTRPSGASGVLSGSPVSDKTVSAGISTGNGGRGLLVLLGDGRTAAAQDDEEFGGGSGGGAVLSPLLAAAAVVVASTEGVAGAEAVGLEKDDDGGVTVPPFSALTLCRARRMGPLSRGSVN